VSVQNICLAHTADHNAFADMAVIGYHIQSHYLTATEDTDVQFVMLAYIFV
jgi:hypothetical protein